MADAVVSAVVEQIATILKDRVSYEVKLVRGVDSEIESLSKELENVRNELEDAERKQFAEQGVKAWMVRLEDASYEMRDVLDEWQIALRKFQIQQQQSKNKVCSFISCLCFKKVAVRHDIATKIKNVKGNLDQILADKKRYGFKTSTTTQPPLQRTTIPEVDLAEVHGREFDRDAVASKIFMTASPGQVETKERKLETVSIVGPGGVGKTTLAQIVFNDSRVKDCFELPIWICVSEPFDEVMIVKKIVESVTRRPQDFNHLEVLVQLLKECISGKKLLLVLDDVWTEDRTKWERLKISLKSCGIGSRILVTTRKEKVAKTFDTPENGIHSLGVLSDESCWLLLKRITLFGKDEVECAKYKDIGMKIVSKCKGLPLAAKTLGSLLCCKKNNSLEEWEKVLNSEIWELEEAQVDIFPHLLLSYNELSPALKRCFSYCAVFPKDFEIKVDKVIGHWMALGYLGSDIGIGGGRDMEIRGQQYFENLAMRSLFQDFRKDDSISGKQIEFFKMHDIVHDFAQFLRKNGTAVVEVVGTNKKTSCQVCSPYELVSQVKQYRTLLCDYNKDTHICGCLGSIRVLRIYSRIPHGIEKLIHLRWLDLSLVSHLSVRGLETICNELYNLQTLSLRSCNLVEIPREIGNLINLRHLDLGYNESLEELPREIGNLIKLRHLDLSGNTTLEELPENICDMCDLETLNINDCSMVSKLPQEIHRLVNLKHLYNFNTSLRHFPQGITQLTCLRTLNEIRIGKDMSKLGWLKNFNRLGGSLWLGISLTTDVVEDARDGELRNKEHLEKLEIVFDDEIDIGGVEDFVWVDVLDALQPHPNVQHLSIWFFQGSRLPGWIASPLNQVKQICLNNFSRVSSILLPLGKLSCLEEMWIFRMPRLRFVGREFLHGITITETTIVFPKLKTLTFQDCPNWEEWEDITAQEEDDEKVATLMPRLTNLNIRGCNSLVALPHRLLCKVASSLQYLDITGSTKLDQCYRDEECSPWKSISHINPRIRLIK